MAGNTDQVLLLKWMADTKGIDQSKQALDGLEREGKKTADGLNNSIGKGPRQALKDLGTEAGTAGKGLGGLASLLPMGPAGAGIAVLAGLTAGIGSSVKVAADFQKNLQAVGSALYDNTLSVEENEKQLASLRAEALKVGRDTSKSASEAVVAFGELAKAGIAVTDIVGGAGKAVVNIAEATGKPVEQMATMFADLKSQFGLSVEGVTTAMDHMARVGAATTLDITDLQAAMANVGPVAASLNMSAEETANALGVLGQQGIKGAEGGTALRGLLLRLTAPTDAAKAALDDLGVSVFDVNGNMRKLPDVLADLNTGLKDLTQEERTGVMKTIFDSYTITAGNALIQDSTKKFEALTEGVSKQATVSEQAAIRLKGMSGAMEQLKGSIETAQILLGEKFLPGLTAAALMATKALNFLLSGELLKMLQNMPVVGPILDQVSTAFRMLTTTVEGMWDIVSGIFEGDWDRVWSGVKTVVGGGVEYVRETISNLGGYLKDFSETLIRPAFEKLREGIREGLSHIPGALEALPGLLKDGIDFAGPIVLQAGQDLLARLWEGAKAGFEGGVGILSELLPQIPGAVRDKAGDMLEAGQTLIASLWTWLSDELPQWPGRIWGFLKETPVKVRELFGEIPDGVKVPVVEAAQWLKDELSEWPSRVWSFIASVPDKLCEAFKNGKTAIVNGITGAWEWLSANVPKIPSAMGSALGGVVDILCDVAKKATAGFTSFLSSGFSRVREPLDWVLDRLNDFVTTVNNLLEKIKAPTIPLLGRLGGGSAPGGGGDFSGGGVSAPAGSWNMTLSTIPETSCYAIGGKIDEEQIARLGEDAARGFEEYVISTNPSYRDRNMKLLAAAAARMGVDPHKMMGIGDFPNPISFLGDAASALMGSVTDWIKKGAKAVLQEVMARMSLSFPEGLGGDLAKGVFEWVKDGVAAHFQSGLDGVKATAGGGAMGWPLAPNGVITQGFGGNTHIYGPGGHSGIDISSGTGRGALLAALLGQTSYAGWLDPRGTGGYGNAVILQHLNNLSTLYGHSSHLMTSVGREHMLGDQIGVEGSTGFSTGPHVHFEVRQGGVAVDPMSYLKAADGAVVKQRLLLYDPISGRFVGEMGEQGQEAIVPLSGTGGTGMVGVNIISVGGALVPPGDLFGTGGAGGAQLLSNFWEVMLLMANGRSQALMGPAAFLGPSAPYVGQSGSTQGNYSYSYTTPSGSQVQHNSSQNMANFPGLFGSQVTRDGRPIAFNIGATPGAMGHEGIRNAMNHYFRTEEEFWRFLGYRDREHFERAQGPELDAQGRPIPGTGLAAEAGRRQDRFSDAWNAFSPHGSQISPLFGGQRDVYTDQAPGVLARMSDDEFKRFLEIIPGDRWDQITQLRADTIKNLDNLAKAEEQRTAGLVALAQQEAQAVADANAAIVRQERENAQAQAEADANAARDRAAREAGGVPVVPGALTGVEGTPGVGLDDMGNFQLWHFAEQMIAAGETAISASEQQAIAAELQERAAVMQEQASAAINASMEAFGEVTIEAQETANTLNAQAATMLAAADTLNASAQAQITAADQAAAAAAVNTANTNQQTINVEDETANVATQTDIIADEEVVVDGHLDAAGTQEAAADVQAKAADVQAAAAAPGTQSNDPQPSNPSGTVAEFIAAFLAAAAAANSAAAANAAANAAAAAAAGPLAGAAEGVKDVGDGTYLVGEEGIELLQVKGGRISVTPNRETLSFLAKMGRRYFKGFAEGTMAGGRGLSGFVPMQNALNPGAYNAWLEWSNTFAIPDNWEELMWLERVEEMVASGEISAEEGALILAKLGYGGGRRGRGSSTGKDPGSSVWASIGGFSPLSDDSSNRPYPFSDMFGGVGGGSVPEGVTNNLYFMPPDPQAIAQQQRDAYFARRLSETVRGRR